jgi:hypothetical protein
MLTFMLISGWVFVIFGCLYLLLKLHMSFDSEGGAIGGAPVLDGALFGPGCIWFGIWFIQWSETLPKPPHWPVWVFALGSLLSVLVSGWLISLFGNWGERYHQNHPSNANKM